MKKLLLLLLLVPLLNSCSKGDDSSIGDFFENQSGKIWSFTYSNDDRAPFTLYHSFSDGTLKTTQYINGQRYCTEKFLGTINNISHPYLLDFDKDDIGNPFLQCNIRYTPSCKVLIEI